MRALACDLALVRGLDPGLRDQMASVVPAGYAFLADRRGTYDDAVMSSLRLALTVLLAPDDVEREDDGRIDDAEH